MAYFLTPNTKFKPFSYQEMLAPVLAYKEAYDAQEEALAELDVLAGDVASKIANENPDSEVSKTYKKYQEDLDKTLTSFYDTGYSLQTKKDLAKLKARYTKEINPINEAYKRYTEYNNNISKLALTNPELIVQGNYSISDFMGGNTPTPTVVNTEDLMNQAMTTAKTQAGRTYRESNWTSTAGGRFLERTKEFGLTDVEFNNALSQVKASSDGLTYKDAEGNTQQLSDNAKLLYASIADVTGGTDFKNLTSANKIKALESIIKGVRAGFQYDRKVETNNDPMFAYNLDIAKQAAKDAAKRNDKLGRIGSSYFATPESRISDIKSSMLNIEGKLNNQYTQYFSPEGGLISKTDSNTGSYQSGYSTQYGYVTPYNVNTTGQFLFGFNDYDDLKQAIIDIGLDPETVTKEQFENAVFNSADVIKRQRATITSDTKGFSIIQSQIEKGLRNNPEIKEVIGFREPDANESQFNTNKRYKTKSGVKYKDLLNDKGVLDIVSIDMDYSTGEMTFTVRDKKGKMRDFIMPVGASFEADDAKTIQEQTNIIHDAYRGYHTMYNNKTREYVKVPIEQYLNKYHPNIKSVQEYIEYIQDEADLIFGNILNYVGAEDIND